MRILKFILCTLAALPGLDQGAFAQPVITGAACMEEYLPVLKGRKVALLINQTSVVGNALLVDTLQRRGVHIVKLFAPEHGFRGREDAGAHIHDEKDSKTGLPVISLHGDNKKPKKGQLADVDVVVYDIQDAGARFYTYISTLEYVMEACAENNKLLLVLDRPNPNGHYVDGPVLEKTYRSFVGRQPIPVVYGMTPGEYACMLKGEQWIKNSERLNLKVVRCRNYDHRTMYQLPVPPSPNLKTMASVYLYPSLCLFEGTLVSMGRGTDKPFQQFGHPSFPHTGYSFTPRSMTGATRPPYRDQVCHGKLVCDTGAEAVKLMDNKLRLVWLLQAYRWTPDSLRSRFFTDFFETLAGTSVLRRQIEQRMDEEEIRKSWEDDLAAFKKIRKRYLLYKDFE